MNRRHGYRVAASAVVTVLLLSACSGSSSTEVREAGGSTEVAPAGPAHAVTPSPEAQVDDASRAELFEYFRGREADPGPGLPWYDDITDVLPNVVYESPEGTRGLTDLVIHGKIVEIQAGVGYKFDDAEDAPGSIEVSFDDPDALWVTAHLVVDVIEKIGPGKNPGDRMLVQIELSKARDLDRIRPGFTSMESVVLFLRAGGPVLKNDNSKYRIYGNGKMFAEVVGGSLRLPWIQATNPEREDDLLSVADNLDELKVAGNRPTEVRRAPDYTTPPASPRDRS